MISDKEADKIHLKCVSLGYKPGGILDGLNWLKNHCNQCGQSLSVDGYCEGCQAVQEKQNDKQ